MNDPFYLEVRKIFFFVEKQNNKNVDQRIKDVEFASRAPTLDNECNRKGLRKALKVLRRAATNFLRPFLGRKEKQNKDLSVF